MIEKCFVLHLPDYACPAAVSGDKLYFGSEDDLKTYLNNDNTIRHLSINPELLKTFLSNVKQKIAYDLYQLGEMALVMGEETAELPATEWQHLNVWGFPYDMCFDKCQVSIIWLRFKGKYYRCIKPKFLSLSYYNESIEEYKFINTFWGQPGYFRINGNWHECALYVIEKEFKNTVKLLDDMNAFYAPDIDFSHAVEEVFGDG